MERVEQNNNLEERKMQNVCLWNEKGGGEGGREGGKEGGSADGIFHERISLRRGEVYEGAGEIKEE